MGDARAVYNYLSNDLRYEPQEVLVLLLLDAKQRLIRRINIAKGTLTRLITHPRDIFREAIRHNAACFVIAHNHPSGDPSPSKADKELTRSIKDAADIIGIRIADHVVIGTPAPDRLPYFSFVENGLLERKKKNDEKDGTKEQKPEQQQEQQPS